MATRPKGYLTKGKTNSADAMRKSKARESLTPRGIAGIVGNAVLNSPAGRVGKAAKVSSKVMLAARREMRKKAAGVGQGKKISSVAARREAERAAGPKARSVTGNPNRASSSGAIRATAPKPGVKVTTITSRGTKVTGGIKRTTNKGGSAIRVKRKPPMSPKEIAKNKYDKNAAAKTARSIEGGVGKRPARPGGPKMDEPTRIKNRGLAVVSKGKSMSKSPSLKDYDYAPGKIKENSRPSIESRESQNPASRGRNIENAAEPFDKQAAEAESRVNQGLRNRTGGEYEFGKGKKPDLPKSKAIGEAARQRPGLRKRKETSIAESRSRANTAMNKKGLTAEEKRKLVMQSRAKARKIREGTK